MAGTKPKCVIRIEPDDYIIVKMPDGPDKIILLFKCPKCDRSMEIDQFGVRNHRGKGPQGVDLITEQSWCRDCR